MADEQIIEQLTAVPEGAPAETPSNDAPEPKLSLREELSKNFNELREPKELRAKPPAKAPDGDKPVSAAGSRPRDETGKFVPKDEKTDKTVEAQKAAPVVTATKTDAPPAPASTPSGLPPGWSPETKAFVNSLPEGHPLKADVAKREKEVSDGFKKYSDDAKKYSEIEQVLAPVRSVFQQAGIQSDAQAINSLLMWENSFRNPQTRLQAFHNLAQRYGVDLASFAQNPGSNQTPPDVTTAQHIQHLVNQAVQPVQTELQRFQTDRAAAEIAAFSKDKPDFEKVKETMGQLMANRMALDLPSAYEQAIKLNPETDAARIQRMIDERSASIQKEQQEKVQRSQDARKAAISPRQSAPAAPQLNGKEKTKGVRGSILSAIESIREERA